MYQMGRINSWLDPYTYSSSDGYHLTESLKAIGSGQLIGKGYNHGEVYIPENHTDFIFSVVRRDGLHWVCCANSHILIFSVSFN